MAARYVFLTALLDRLIIPGAVIGVGAFLLAATPHEAVGTAVLWVGVGSMLDMKVSNLKRMGSNGKSH